MRVVHSVFIDKQQGEGDEKKPYFDKTKTEKWQNNEMLLAICPIVWCDRRRI